MFGSVGVGISRALLPPCFNCRTPLARRCKTPSRAKRIPLPQRRSGGKNREATGAAAAAVVAAVVVAVDLAVASILEISAMDSKSGS